jgi:hypothetical protein
LKAAHATAVTELEARNAKLQEELMAKVGDSDLVLALSQETRYRIENMKL